jgi:UDP-3-O-[3-hydroxymyristoyl] glucosamine N-acyltransferase
MAQTTDKHFGTTTSIRAITEKLGSLVTSKHWAPENKAENKETAGNSIEISSVNSPEFANAGQVAFVTRDKYLESSFQSLASVLCFPESARELVSKRLSGETFRPHFFSKEPELAMRETIQNFFQRTPYVNRDFSALIHPTAIIHPDTVVASTVRIGPYAVIAKGVEIGHDAVIAAHTIVETGSKIGARTVLHPFVYVGPTCDIGDDCEINPSSVIGKEGFGYAHDLKNNHHRIPHTGRVIIEDRVHIGANVNVDRGTFENTRICHGAILDNRVQISHNAVVGTNSVITAGFIVAGSSKIGKNFLTGGNSSVTGHIEVCDNVQLAALSVVRKSITKSGAYGGNPLMPMRDYMRMSAALAKLPQLLKEFRALLGRKSSAESDS